jgi:signal transduction histidine kinase
MTTPYCSVRGAVTTPKLDDLTKRRESALEQAALRRIATLVAGDAAPAEIFAAVSTEVDRLFGLDPATYNVAVVGRVDPGPELVVVGISKRNEAVPLGTRWPLDDLFAPTRVLRTGRSARIRAQDVLSATGEIAEFLRQHGFLSQVAAPIVVDGRLWGAMSVTGGDDFPPDTEERLESFTELVATAIANTESRDALSRLADEQAALRRVATLVARDTAPAEIFAAVSTEVDRLLGLDPATPDIAIVSRIDPGPALVVVGISKHIELVPLGSRWPLDDLFAPTRALRSGRSARIRPQDVMSAAGEMAELLRQHRYLSQVSSPIVVDGRLWGTMSVTGGDDFPPDTEERLESFTELVATAIANAENRLTFSQLADQQAALGRVATLVAEGAAPADVFNAVAWEVAQLFDFAAVTLSYYEDDAVVVVADPQDSGFPVGSRWPFDGDSLSVRVRATGRMARIDNYSRIDGSAAARMRERDSRSAVGVPIVVEGSLWGILCVGAAATLLLPSDIEARIAGFVELVGTAIANSQARDALHLLADEQAALRRVATLVARGTPPGKVFDAVAMEVGKLLSTDVTVIGRYDGDGTATATGSWSASPGGVPVGTRSMLGGRNVLTLVAETERPARVDGYEDASGEATEIARRHGWRSSIAAPISVEGRLWGVMLVASQRSETFPAGAEERLSAFTDLVATAIANAQSKSELAASRLRIVAAADEARRRIERDLHDGIQQRLIALTFRARAMTRRPTNELPELAAELSEGLKDTSDELREISRGIHPTILTEAGLGPALRALARRSSVPIDVHVTLDERLPEAIEAAAYYIASEALTNVAKHAQANVVELVAAHDNGMLTLEVRDDGIGGVDARGGSGILGLTDRVEALGGTISIDSPSLHGTTLSVRLPPTA